MNVMFNEIQEMPDTSQITITVIIINIIVIVITIRVINAIQQSMCKLYTHFLYPETKFPHSQSEITNYSKPRNDNRFLRDG